MAELTTRTGVTVSVADDRADTLDGPYWRPTSEAGGATAPAQSGKKPEPKRSSRSGDK